MKKEKILGFDVTICNIQQLLSNIFNDYSNNNKLFIVNINPEIILNNYKNNEIKEIFNKQKYQIPDGIGVVWASKKLNGNISERITGIDLMDSICDHSQNYNSKIFLYGSKPGIAEKAKIELKCKYPNINIVGTCDGYTPENDVIHKINNSQADILFVGLGTPLQEQFIIDNKNKLTNIKIFMPIGGSLDVISNTIKRAPNWIIKFNLEWLYRLLKQPKRIFRQIKLIKFIILILINKNSGGKKNG